MGLKLATVTLDGYFNYGNVLQRYALCHILDKFGGTVDSIWCQPEVTIFSHLLNKYSWMEHDRSFKLAIKLLLNWKGITSTMLHGYNAWEASRVALIKSFLEKHVSIKYNVDFSNIADSYDYFIVGSDQVWNPYFADFEKMFIKFAPKSKSISYAASISCPHIPNQYRESFIDGINHMMALSVREQAGAELIKKMTGREAEVLVDPTMLVSAGEWRSISRKPMYINDKEKLLVTYFLGDRPDELISRLAKEYNLKIINILDKKIFDHYVISPEEWLWLMDHAKLVYTDSFHGTVFSILFNTPFVVLNRMDIGYMNYMTSRIDTLLEKFLMQRRINTRANKGDNGIGIINTCMENVSYILQKERKKANDYLIRNIFK